MSEACEERAEAAYDECIDDGGEEERCREAYATAYDECMESEEDPR